MKLGTEEEREVVTKNSWRSMHSRCKYTPHYVNNGITVCERWSSYDNFREDMKLCPFLDFTIDRLDNSKGYFKENCKWRSRFAQAWNRSLGEYRGVSFRNDTKKWMAQVMLSYKTFGLGCYDTREEALEAYRSHARLIDWLMETEIIP